MSGNATRERKYPVKTVAVLVTLLLLALYLIEQRNSDDLADYSVCVERALAAGSDLDEC